MHKSLERICFTQASGSSPKSKKTPTKQVASSGGSAKKGGEAKKSGKQTGNGEMSEDDPASASSTPKKGVKDTSRKRKLEEGPPVLPAVSQESPVNVKRAKTARDNNRDLGLCRYVFQFDFDFNNCIVVAISCIVPQYIHVNSKRNNHEHNGPCYTFQFRVSFIPYI